MSDDAPKSAIELAMARLRKKDAEAGRIDSPLSEPQKGEIVAAGEGRWDEDGEKRVPLDVSKGDVVLYSKYGGTDIKVDGEDLLVLVEKVGLPEHTETRGLRHGHATRGRLGRASEDAQQRGLGGARRPDHRELLARAHLQGPPLQFVSRRADHQLGNDIWFDGWPVQSAHLARDDKGVAASILVGRCQDLLAQDVGMSAVLSEFAQHVKQDPAQRQLPAAVATDDIVDCSVSDRGA